MIEKILSIEEAARQFKVGAEEIPAGGHTKSTERSAAAEWRWFHY